MTTVRSATSHKALSAGKQLLILAVPIALFIVITYIFPTVFAGAVFFALFAAAFGTFLVYMIRNPRRFAWGRFACPSCNTSVEKPLENGGIHGEPILYLCSACDILWHVGNTDRD